LFGRGGLLIFGTLNTLAIIAIGLAETGGAITTYFGPLTDRSTVFTSAFFMVAASLTLYFFVTRLSNLVVVARMDEQNLMEANRDLNELKTILEQRVESRTSQLQLSNKKLKTKLSQVKKLQAKLIEEAIRDPLTELYNRRFMNENLSLEIARAKRLNFPITIFFLDIDHFKDFNDQYGHQVGDEILKGIGKILSTGLRAGDIACRFGGEEFIIVLPGMPKEKAKIMAERIKDRIRNLVIPNLDIKAKITISIGIAVYPQDATLIEELIFLADQALYFAKIKGRDRVELINQEK
jgi:diguanylate cyclase (GGDEF)-like protein